MQLRAFLAALAPVAARQPQVFVEACRAAVDIQGECTWVLSRSVVRVSCLLFCTVSVWPAG